MSELYLKDKKVLTLKDTEGVPSEIQRIDAPELLPVCLKEKCTIENFNSWLDGRKIPDTRENLDAVKEIHGTSWLSSKSYAALTDQYWLRHRSETWKKVNYFTNRYDTIVGDMFFLPWKINKQRKYSNNSPDLTTGGVLMKRWLQNSDMSSRLVKAGSYISHQEPLSEVLVSVLVEKMGIIPCVKYDMWIEGVTVCSICDNIVDINTELVPASQIYDKGSKSDSESVYTHLLKMCEKHDIPGAEDFINGMIFVDNITGNEDRNLGNIGFLRDSETMRFIGPAPLYDSGNAYWSTKKINLKTKSKMFGDIEHKVFKKLKEKFDLEELKNDREFERIVSKYPGITDEKKDALIGAINQRNLRLSQSLEKEEELELEL